MGSNAQKLNNFLVRQKTPTEMKNMTTGGQCNTPTGPKTPVFSAAIGLSQNDTPSRRLMHSPSLDFISPNDDETERARVRAARAAQRRRSVGSQLEPSGTGQSASTLVVESNILSPESLKSMLQNCLKLSNANKINQGNTWDLKLIDHLSDLVRTDVDDNAQTNFQMASCTLETGVKIYSCRVDSVHSEAYRLLGGLGRSANETPAIDQVGEDGDGQGSKPLPVPPTSKKTGATLLASDEVLNVKKLDVAFNVDPLFHQMSALFDDGGAQGLLLNNLSVYSGCEIIFDSSEVPETSMKAWAPVAEESDAVDLSFMKDIIGDMMDALRQEPELTPTLKEIVKLVDDPRRAEFESEGAEPASRDQPLEEEADVAATWSSPSSTAALDNDPGEVFDQVDDELENNYNGSVNGGTSPRSGAWSEINEDQEDIDGIDGEADGSDDVFMSHDSLEWLAMGTGMTVKSNNWAGPDYWKYAKSKDDLNNTQTGSDVQEKPKRKRKEPFSIDFENPPEIDLSIFDPAKNPRSLLMAQSTVPMNTLLPEDYHFDAGNLAKFFLRNSVWAFRQRSKKTSGEQFREASNDVSWGDDANDLFQEWADDEPGDGEVEDDPTVAHLVPEPRKVQKISITYDKQAKQVDVRLLKRAIWEQVQHGSSEPNEENAEENENGLSFQQILNHFPEDCPAAAKPEDISVHLCFICLLHLANEHSLRLDSCAAMDDLQIYYSSLDDFEPTSV